MLRQHCQGGSEVSSRSGHDVKGLSRSRPDVPCGMPDNLRVELPEVQPQAVGNLGHEHVPTRRYLLYLFPTCDRSSQDDVQVWMYSRA